MLSVVSFAADGTVYVGREAQRRLLTEPDRTVYSVKRFMGRGIDDVSGEGQLLPFRVSGEAGVVRIGVGEREQTPPEISAFVLRELKRRAEDHFREEGEFDFEVDRAVITVPAYFNDAQRTPPATPAVWPGSRCCGSSTSRRRRRWPTGWTRAITAPSRSTTWAAALSTSRSCASRTVFQVLATGGDTHLGGDDIDLALTGLVLRAARGGQGVRVAGRDDSGDPQGGDSGQVGFV